MFTEIFCLFHPEITCSDNGECVPVHTEILEVIRGTHAVGESPLTSRSVTTP